MYHPVYQEFLLQNAPTQEAKIPLQKCPPEIEAIREMKSIPWNLFDYARGKWVRRVDCAFLDDHIGTEADMQHFIGLVKPLDELVVYVSLYGSRNPILINYRKATLQAYLQYLQPHVSCFVSSETCPTVLKALQFQDSRLYT